MRKSEFIEQQIFQMIHDGEFIVGTALPSIRELMRKFDVSDRTISLALRSLEKKNVVNREKNRGPLYIQPSALGLNFPNPSKDKTNSMSLIEVIQEHVLLLQSDTFLPSRPELTKKFGCNDNQLKKALEILCRRKFLVRQGRKYRINKDVQPNKKGAIQILGVARQLWTQPHLFFPLIQSIQDQLYDLNWPFGKFLLNRDDPIPDNPRLRSQSGFVYIHIREGSDYWTEFLLKYPEVPKVVIDAIESSTAWTRILKKTIRISPDNFDAGLSVAGYLHNLGHKQVAIFPQSPDKKKYEWMQSRLMGMQQIFPPKGQKLKSTVFFPNSLTRNIHLFNEIPVILAPEAREELKKFDQIGWKFLSHCENLVEIKNLTDVIEMAIEDRNITAWICMNDLVAFQALRTLKKRNIKVPEDISVISFDNSQAAYAFGISSFDFRWNGIGRAAINSLAKRSFLEENLKSIQVKGYVFPRSTTGPAKNRA